ncbi:transmembrane protein 45B [Rhipicephalus sanguineus]|uniref:transmembrane protein 45B n=1 Tax=Rhipicephalus sanguineus TaxID=34632 RepID=UPI0018955C0C|nr:transmembrane protein 45B [Rhipicephalus sanguineus]
MANFQGHTLAGTFFFLFGTWWTFAMWLNYVRKRENKQRYLSRCSYAVPGLPRKMSIEGIVKIIGTSVCITIDTRYLFRFDHSLNAESVQHHSMYAFFMLNGLIDVMYNAGFPFPRNTDYVVMLLACASDGLLFYSHLGGKPQLEVMVHALLVCSMVAIVACIVAEMCQPRNVLLSLGRAYFCLLYGTWLWQIGFILYNPLPGSKPWDVNSHMDSMLAASVFVWHMMALLVYVGAVGAVAWAVTRTCGKFCNDVVSVDEEEVGDLREAFLKSGV